MVGVEIAFGAVVLHPLLGTVGATTVVVTIGGIGILYSYLAGFRGCVRTDYIQGKLMLFGAFGIIGGCILLAWNNWPLTWPSDYTSWRFYLMSNNRPDIAGMVVLLLSAFCWACDRWSWRPTGAA